MPKVLITGGTGLVGRYLISFLKKKARLSDGQEFSVSVLSRKKFQTNEVEVFQWDLAKKFIDENAITDVDYIIHLAGANIGEKRWTEKRKKEILDSRVRSSELLYEYLSKTKNKVKVVISASGVGIYGNGKPLSHPLPEGERSEEKIFSEEDLPANDFLGQTCQQWESAVNKISQLNKRVVIFRFGVVLAKDAEVLKKLMLSVNFFIAPVFGNGKQFFPWIHIDDLCGMILKAIEEEKINGVYNAVAPQPITNKDFVSALASTLNKPALKIFIPEFLLKIGLGEMANTLLDSQKVSAEKILKEGFHFNYPGINER